MKNTPEFNHCYTADPGHRFLASLKRKGFRLDPRVTEHPGRRVLTPAKRNAFRAVVLMAREFKRFCRWARPDAWELRGTIQAAVYWNPAGSWDIVVVDGR